MNESGLFLFAGCATCRCVTAALTNPDAPILRAPFEIPRCSSHRRPGYGSVTAEGGEPLLSAYCYRFRRDQIGLPYCCCAKHGPVASLTGLPFSHLLVLILTRALLTVMRQVKIRQTGKVLEIFKYSVFCFQNRFPAAAAVILPCFSSAQSYGVKL